jgi:hypothetical protein
VVPPLVSAGGVTDVSMVATIAASEFVALGLFGAALWVERRTREAL